MINTDQCARSTLARVARSWRACTLSRLAAGYHWNVQQEAQPLHKASSCTGQSVEDTEVMASLSAGSDAHSGFECPPINIIYSHYHNAIRAELSRLANNVNELEKLTTGKLAERLAALRTQCRFLEKIYKYHSSVEDEVSPGTLKSLRKAREQDFYTRTSSEN